MKIFITGAAGFLGRYIAEEFRRAGHEVSGTDVRPAGSSSLRPGEIYRQMELPDQAIVDLLGRIQPEVCLHCAGGASVAASLGDARSDFRSSVVVTEQLLSAIAATAPRCRTIFLSSAAVYGQPSVLPVTEDAPTSPLSPYGYHKRMCELLFEQAAVIRGIPTAVLRIFSAYGPGLRRQVLWEMASQLARGENIQLKGTGDESRDFVHASDIAAAAKTVADQAPCRGEAYNVASGKETGVRQAAELMTSFFPGAAAPRFAGQSIPGDPQRWQADCQRLVALGFEPCMPLDKGLASLAEWTKEQVAATA